MFRFFPNAKRSLDSLFDSITDLLVDGLLFFRLLFRSRTSMSVGSLVRKAGGLLSGEVGPTKTIERLRPFLPHSLVLLIELERCLGNRQTRDPDRLASKGLQVCVGNGSRLVGRDFLRTFAHSSCRWHKRIRLGVSTGGSEVGYVSPRTVRAYWPPEPERRGHQRTSSQNWRTFVRNQAFLSPRRKQLQSDQQFTLGWSVSAII
jgi:hypothetical protein